MSAGDDLLIPVASAEIRTDPARGRRRPCGWPTGRPGQPKVLVCRSELAAALPDVFTATRDNRLSNIIGDLFYRLCLTQHMTIRLVFFILPFLVEYLGRSPALIAAIFSLLISGAFLAHWPDRETEGTCFSCYSTRRCLDDRFGIISR